MKLTKAAIVTTLLSLTTTSAFIVPGGGVAPTALNASSSSSPNNNTPVIILGTTIATAITTAVSPLAVFAAEQAAENEDYVYGAVNAPGGIGLAAVLGVLAILTAAVPVVLAPGEDAFNEMKDRDEKKWGK